jgi:hypothetical protein
MAHTNGHGDFVLLELGDGPQWEVHSCYMARTGVSERSPGSTRTARAQDLRALYASAEIPPANIRELDIHGTVISIADAVIPLRLSNLRPDIRNNACYLLGRLLTEVVLTSNDQYTYRICTDPQTIIFGPGDSVRALVDRVRICGMGIMFLCKKVSLF